MLVAALLLGCRDEDLDAPPPGAPPRVGATASVVPPTATPRGPATAPPQTQPPLTVYGPPPMGRIAFQCTVGLCVMESGSPAPRVVVDELPSPPVLSPDGIAIAYYRGIPAERRRVLVVQTLDGSAARDLAPFGPTEYPRSPQWSPDGRSIAMETGLSAEPGGDIDIVIVDVETGVSRVLVQHPAADIGPAWSPDGREIAFASERDGNLEIYVAGSEGEAPRRVTEHEAVDVAPAWLPDGRIAFFSMRDGNWELYVARADGSGLENLTRHPGGDFGGVVGHVPPAVSPRGDYIAFLSDRDRVGNGTGLYLARSNGAGVSMVTARSVASPEWSPDGRYLAYVLAVGQGMIEVVDLDSGATTRIAEGIGPSWRP